MRRESGLGSAHPAGFGWWGMELFSVLRALARTGVTPFETSSGEVTKTGHGSVRHEPKTNTTTPPPGPRYPLRV